MSNEQTNIETCMCYRQIVGPSIIEAVDACPTCKPQLDAARAELPAPHVTRTTRRPPRVTRDASSVVTTRDT